MNKQEYEKQAPRPEPEAFGYNGQSWPTDDHRDAYHKALNSWVEQRACPFLHTVKRTEWIPYSIVVEARGAKVGDIVQYCSTKRQVSEICQNGTIGVVPIGSDANTKAIGYQYPENMLYEAKATYNFQ